MCLAVPAHIESISGLEAEAVIGGVSRTVSLWLTPEVRVGDYVYLHAGFAISVVDEALALDSLRLLQALAEECPLEELFLSRGDLPARPGP